MIKNFSVIILMSLFILSLASCSTQVLVTPAIPTHTTIPPTQPVLPSATSIPPTETPTPLPPSPTVPPVNPIQHYPTGQEFTVTFISMIDSNVGWAIGSLQDMDDHVLRTSNGGVTWTDLTPPEAAAPIGEHKKATGYFQDTQVAWVIYSNASGITPKSPIVWHTQDSGSTWLASQPLDTTDLTEFYNPSNLQFVNGGSGWLIAHVGVGMNHDYIVLYRSNDGGLTWERLLDPYNDTNGIMGCSKSGMLFTDATHGWLTGDCHGVAAGVLLFRSSDGGATWERISLPDPAGAPGLFSNFQAACGSYSPFFFGNDLGHLSVNCANYDQDPITYQYYVYTTQDGGTTWTSSTYPGEALHFLFPDSGWAFSKQIRRTTDGGITWKIISNVSWTVLGEFTANAMVDFVSEDMGWAIARADGEVALVITTNSGVKWAILVPTVGQ